MAAPTASLGEKNSLNFSLYNKFRKANLSEGGVPEVPYHMSGRAVIQFREGVSPEF